MAVPFFSIDLTSSEVYSYLTSGFSGSTARNKAEGLIKKLLAARFPDYRISLAPSARVAFFLVLKSRFNSGDEIIFPALGFPLYVKIALQLGLVPVLVDVEPDNLTIDPFRISAAITKKTKGIIVTHLFGHPARMMEILQIAKEHGIPVIEDSAQSFDSFVDNKETGTNGLVGIFSCSLMKIPTMLGGGIVVTKDESLYRQIEMGLEHIYLESNKKPAFAYHLKGLVSVLNSSLAFYTIFSHGIFGLLKSRNPALLRSILYSGMGMNGPGFDPAERPAPATYQYLIGAQQIRRAREMTLVRRHFSAMIDEALTPRTSIASFKEQEGCFWNRQYHVIDLGTSEYMNFVFDNLFKAGVHVMREDVWDCTRYDLPGVRFGDLPVAKSRNPGLLRIPNSSYLTEKTIERITLAIRRASKR
jgi:dTDP-4-amino-4,6-dideoxygalactose transaminase